ncbi:MAG: hypothetical protein GKR94_33225 [Gammaproteobacteria bacterium]|nr:hypothetical protein [Gammaproteobacteria bacterium]
MTVALPLIEMHWGAYEGRTLVELRAGLGDGMAVNEARGLDFKPPGGESPRQVQVRVLAWLRRQAAAWSDGEAALVSHQGMLCALLALTIGWDMRGKPPVRWGFEGCAQLIPLDRTGGIAAVAHIIPLPAQAGR